MNVIEREPIWALQEALSDLPQIELPTYHHFADGMYARVCFFKAGDVAVGKVQRREHFFVVTRGCMMVGDQRCEAGTVIVGKAGSKRAVMALEDSMCMTLHRTNKKNVTKIERELIMPDKSAKFTALNQLKVKELT